MTSNFDIEKSLNPRLAVLNYKTLLKNSLKKAEIAKSKLQGKIDLKYGDSNLQTLDVYFNTNKSNLPIHIFIHGGYWRALDKNYHTHMATAFVNSNICFFNINYELCPNVKLSEIKDQIIKAITWIYNNSNAYNADNKNIVLSGHSAGAHLASLILSVNWEKHGINKSIFKGLGLISGIFNTELVINLNINKEIGLSVEEAKENNASKLIPKFNIPTIISYGEKEPTLWKEQSIKYMNFLKKNGFLCKEIICNEDNHFSLIDTLSSKNHKLVKELVSLSKC